MKYAQQTLKDIRINKSKIFVIPLKIILFIFILCKMIELLIYFK